MSEETTRDQDGARPFEERVLSMLTDMRSDFNELRNTLKEHFPAIK